MSVTLTARGEALLVRQFEVSVVGGPDRGATVRSQSDELSIGTNDGNDLRVTDPAVSRHHCVLRACERGLELSDLASRNGTFVGGFEAVRCFVSSGTEVRIGNTTLSIRILDRDLEQPIGSSNRCGPVLGASPAMRRLYPLVERCAASNATVLIFGETGTGKELFAEAIHDLGPRRHRPFVTIDCSALSHDLAESELFGHDRGAFTGADADRMGAFESADGGTIFLDEIGELPPALQPILLRVLENRTIRRIGSNARRPVDVRVIAASCCDLRVLVNEKRFRADLFYRLHVVRLDVPPLRERAGDVALLATHFWHRFRSEPPPPKLLQHLAAHTWPGNVRELRNAVERAALLGFAAQPAGATAPSYQEARERAVHEWEARWVEKLIAEHGGNLSSASRAARMGRSHLREIARRHGVVTRPSTVDLKDE